MWNKIIEYTFKFLLMPLLTKGLHWLIDYFKDSKEDSGRDNEVDDAVEKLKQAKTEQERKDALKELVRGIGHLNP